MPIITGADRTYDAGVPSQYTQDFGVTVEGLIVGDVPPAFVVDIPVALSQTLEAYHVVALNASGNIIEADISAVDPADHDVAIGVLLYPVTTAGSGSLPVGRVLRGGCIKPDLLVFHSSYDTTAKKIAAFDRAPAPTQIVVRPLATYTPVLP